MIKIGIDFSINSPGICIDDGEQLFFYGGLRDVIKKRTKLETKCIEIISNLEGCSIFSLPLKSTGSNYSDQENIDLQDGIICVDAVMNILRKHIKDPKDCLIGIEGFSYNSKGSSTSRIYGYGYMLRYVLNKEGYTFKVFAPTTVKMTAGKGNFKKVQMGDAFVENAKKDSKLNLNFLYNTIINNINSFKNKAGYLKPLEDIIDSYWVLRSLN